MFLTVNRTAVGATLIYILPTCDFYYIRITSVEFGYSEYVSIRLCLYLNQEMQMASITLEGNEIHTIGTLPAVGSDAPGFNLTNSELGASSMSDYSGKKVVMNIFPSIDTGVCAQSTRRFNETASNNKNTVILCISADLPFALSRFCGAENLDDVVTLSTFRNPEFGEDYGVRITDGPIKGLMSRAVVVIDENNKVIHAEQIPEITQEPDYEAALAKI
jgi:thiol peroxidase